MEQFAGLDVSVNETRVCIVDETGKIVREVRWRASLLTECPASDGCLDSRQCLDSLAKQYAVFAQQLIDPSVQSRAFA